MATKPIPDAYRNATPYLIVNDAIKAIEFYKRAFGATELVRLADATGKVMHAELRIDNSPIMLADEFPDMGYRSAKSFGGTPVSILLYVAEVDVQFARAIAAGAKETMPVSDQFDGDRRGTLTDPLAGRIAMITSERTVMPTRSPMILAFLLLITSLAHVQTSDDHARDRAYIRQAESDWAESVVTNDVSVLERILADDFLGVDIDGSHYSKADGIRDFQTKPSEFAPTISTKSRFASTGIRQ